MRLDVSQVEAVVDSYIDKYKKWVNSVDYRKYEAMFKPNNYAYNEVIFPEYWAGYNRAVNQYEGISVHFNRGKFPERAFRERAPNQTLAEEIYIRNNFKSVTLSVAEDFINTLCRGTNPNNWTLEFTEDGLKFKEYIERQVPKFGSIEGFWSSLLPPIYLQDANGIICLRPDRLSYVTDENDEVIIEDGLATIDNSDIRPMPFYFNSSNIVGQELHEWYLVNTAEKSVVKVGNTEERKGFVLELYDSDCIWRIVQVGNKKDYKYEISEYYRHDLNFLPAWKLGGRPTYSQENGLAYNSVFNSVVDILDDVLIDRSTLNLVKKKCVFPYRVVLGDICEFEHNGSKCDNGRIFSLETGVFSACPNCNGFGVTSRVNAGGEMIIKPGNDLISGDSGLKGDMIKYVSPDVTTLEFLREEIRTGLTNSRKQLHLRSSDREATGAPDSATGVLDEQKALQAFLRPCVNDLFYLLDQMLTGVGKMRYGADFEEFHLNPPQDLDISTPSEYLAMIKEAREAGAPSIVIQQLMMQYLRCIEFTNDIIAKAFDLINQTDDLMVLTSDEVAINAAAGLYGKWQRYLHDSSVQLIYRLYNDNEDFFEQDFGTQQTQLIEAAKAAVPAEDNSATIGNIIDLANAS